MMPLLQQENGARKFSSLDGLRSGFPPPLMDAPDAGGLAMDGLTVEPAGGGSLAGLQAAVGQAPATAFQADRPNIAPGAFLGGSGGVGGEQRASADPVPNIAPGAPTTALPATTGAGLTVAPAADTKTAAPAQQPVRSPRMQRRAGRRGRSSLAGLQSAVK